MFIFAMVVGLLAIFCNHFGYLNQYIVVAIIATVSDLVYKKLNKIWNSVEESGEIQIEKIIPSKKVDTEEITKNIQSTLNEVSKKFETSALNYDYKSKHQIPIKVNKETGAFVISVEDVINSIDAYMEELGRYNGGNNNGL